MFVILYLLQGHHSKDHKAISISLHDRENI